MANFRSHHWRHRLAVSCDPESFFHLPKPGHGNHGEGRIRAGSGHRDSSSWSSTATNSWCQAGMSTSKGLTVEQGKHRHFVLMKICRTVDSFSIRHSVKQVEQVIEQVFGRGSDVPIHTPSSKHIGNSTRDSAKRWEMRAEQDHLTASQWTEDLRSSVRTCLTGGVHNKGSHALSSAVTEHTAIVNGSVRCHWLKNALAEMELPTNLEVNRQFGWLDP